LEEAAPLFLFQSNTFNISFLNTLLTTIVTSQFYTNRRIHCICLIVHCDDKHACWFSEVHNQC